MDLDKLNQQQREAVTTVEGPVLVLAGAGSGKTRVLTHRIAHILERKLAAPEQILAATFTNKAAGEMKERIAQLLGITNMSRSYLPWMGTFHSNCVKILKQDGEEVGLDRNFTIYDSNDQRAVIKQVMDRLNISQKEVNPRAVQSHISSAKNELVTAESYAQYAQGYFQELVAEIYPQYQKVLRDNNAVDFDDLLMLTVKLFQNHQRVLQKYQQLFKYILVDEYQDTNHAQYEIVNMLAEEHRNLCVVGDDDQSIYAFRGATIKNILNFERDYKDAKVIKLEQNYRSTKNILDAAHEVVAKNQDRTDKRLWTDQGQGEKIFLYKASDERDEASWVATEINNLIEQGEDLSEIAILYRTNAQSRTLEEIFIRKALTYRIIGGVRFYERQEIKDTLAYLRLLFNPKDDTSLNRIINVPRRGIGAKTAANVQERASQSGLSMSEYLLQFGDNEAGAVKKFAELLQKLNRAVEEKHIVDLLEYVLEESGYLAMLDDGSAEGEARIENIKELISVASRYTELGGREGLEGFLEEVSLLEGNSTTDTEEAITLMTVHAAKGLEFKHVFVVGMEEGLFPHSRVFTDPKELEEERRLAYVAITRAKERLYLVHADSRLYFGSRQNNMLSRFAEDIPPELLEQLSTSSGDESWAGWEDLDTDWQKEFQPAQVNKGDKVKHPYFGIGTVLDINDATIKIRFGAVYGVKELARDLAPLEPLS